MPIISPIKEGREKEFLKSIFGFDQTRAEYLPTSLPTPRPPSSIRQQDWAIHHSLPLNFCRGYLQTDPYSGHTQIIHLELHL